jgi:hypothetical protein
MARTTLKYGRVFKPGAKHLRYDGQGLKKPARILGDVIEETTQFTKHLNGAVNLKPLQTEFGKKLVGDNIRQASNVIKPFTSAVSKSVRQLPLSASTLGDNAPALSHLGKAVGQSKSLVKSVGGLFRGRGMEPPKNNIRLVL